MREKNSTLARWIKRQLRPTGRNPQKDLRDAVKLQSAQDEEEQRGRVQGNGSEEEVRRIKIRGGQ